jgi:acyl-CoA thioester hydrolase
MSAALPSGPGPAVATGHVLPIRVYYEDTDAAGIVYYANYLRFAERARSEMLRALGLPPSRLERDHGVKFAVRRCVVDYERPARLDDRVEVCSNVTRLGGATIEMEQEVRRDGATLARLHVALACVGRDGRPRRLPNPVRAAFEAQLAKTVREY